MIARTGGRLRLFAFVEPRLDEPRSGKSVENRASRGLTICTLDVNGKADYDTASRILELGK